MKRFLQPVLLLSLIVAYPLITFGQVNTSFESWQSIKYFDTPEDFLTTNYESYFNAGVANVTKVQGASGSAVRIENIGSGGNIYQGYLSNEPIFNPLGEGLPYTGQPTSVTITAKPQMVGGDSAKVTFSFKKQGTPVNIINVKIGGTSSSFQDYTFNINLNGVQPTHLNLIARITNDAAVVNAGSYIDIDKIKFDVNEQPANNEFENWQEVKAEEPDNWFTSNFAVSILGGVSGNPVVKTSDAYDGSLAAEIRSKTVAIGSYNINLGILSNSPISPIGSVSSGNGAAYTQEAEALTFHYKYSSSGNDMGLVWVKFVDSNGDSINGGVATLPKVSSYTKQQLTFDWSGIDAPDSVFIAFASSMGFASGQGDTTSVLTVDNVVLGDPVGVELQTGAANGIEISPNPAHEYVTFRINEKLTGSATIRVMDMLGRVVAVQEITSSQVTMDVRHLEAGSYLYKIESPSNHFSGKFIKR